MITSLQSNEIFVFGSSLGGIHAGGAARQAHREFDAEWGVGEGMTGKCYAFPALDAEFERLPILHLENARELLYKTCRENPNLRFLLTKVGCGIAGYDESTMRGLFTDAPENLILPEDWK